VDRAVVEGDIIRSLRVIAAPGRTPGQIARFDSRNSALIVGAMPSGSLAPFGQSTMGFLEPASKENFVPGYTGVLPYLSNRVSFEMSSRPEFETARGALFGQFTPPREHYDRRES